MADGDQQLGTSLRLARDLCFGVGAFVVSTGGTIHTELLAEPAVPSMSARVSALALDCLAKPEAQGVDAFWTAEPAGDAGTQSESLACVAVPLHSRAGLVGIMGVVDGWLPELDDEQRRGLLSIAGTVTPLVAGLLPTAQPDQPTATSTATAASFSTSIWSTPPSPPAPAAPPPSVTHPVRDLPRSPLTSRPSSVAPPRNATPTPSPSPSPSTPPTSGPPTSVSSSSARVTSPAPVALPVGGGDQFLAEVVDHHPDGMVVVLDDGTILFANETLVGMTGLAADEVVGADIGGLVTTDVDDPSTADDNAGTLVGNPVPGRRLWLSSASGDSEAVDVVGSRFYSESAAGTCFVGSLRVASAVPESASSAPVAAEAGTHPSAGPAIPNERALDALLAALEEGIVVCDHDGVVLVANQASKALQGLSLGEELEGRTFPTATLLRGPDGVPLAGTDHPLNRALRGTIVDSEQLVIERNEGERRHLLASARPFVLPDGNGALMVLRDVTVQRQDEEWLTHLALHDPLTGLANRYLLLDYLGRMLVDVRSRGGSVALVFLDLDDFKNVNDRLGHDVGDEVLVAVSRRLEGTVRSTDICARIGGDEFVIAHTASSTPEDIELVVSRIRTTLAAPYKVRGDVLTVSASIGWVIADLATADPTSLLVQADQEMYRHKNARHRAES